MAQMNQFFKNNETQNYKQLVEHINKADIVPLDYRNLNSVNQSMVNGWIKAMIQEQQTKILIIR